MTILQSRKNEKVRIVLPLLDRNMKPCKASKKEMQKYLIDQVLEDGVPVEELNHSQRRLAGFGSIENTKTIRKFANRKLQRPRYIRQLKIQRKYGDVK